MTFISPLDTLGENWAVDKTEWELWEGSFGCQERDCWEAAHEAKYAPEKKLLTWKCPKGHVSKIEDYNE